MPITREEMKHLPPIDSRLERAAKLARIRQLCAPPEITRGNTCGTCEWSWASGHRGELLCANPDSPHCYDLVPESLTCAEHVTA
jgi:hypothetical protein